jgi:hypothetical protein
MIEDLSRFSWTVKEYVQNWAKDKTLEERLEGISYLADPLGVPCIVICLWFGEISNWDHSLNKTYNSLYKFYRYTEVKNKPNGCPW